MIEIKCDCCNTSLSSMGAAIISPPQGNGTVQKYHLCLNCWQVISKLVKKSNGHVEISAIPETTSVPRLTAQR